MGRGAVAVQEECPMENGKTKGKSMYSESTLRRQELGSVAVTMDFSNQHSAVLSAIQ
jgi:hypothetical protein